MATSWERRAINIGDGNGGPGAAGMVQFALKNLAADDWKDKTEQQIDASLTVEVTRFSDG